jgi:hypothetical protein
VSALPLLLIPHVWVGVVIPVLLAVELTRAVRFRLLGEVVPGKVLGLWTHKRGRSFSVRYTYRWDGVKQAAVSPIDEAGFGQLAEGDAVEVRVLDGSSRSPQLLVQGAPTEWARLGGLVIFVVIWDGAVLLMAWPSAVWPLIQRSLVRRGAATTGEIIAKEAKPMRRKTSYTLRYRYQTLPPSGDGPAATGEGERARESTMTVEEDDYAGVAVGDRVTVLYNRRWPRLSIVYRCAPYRVLGTGDAAPAQ